ncbi:MAG: aldehyde dehydrogenase family protein, partial [Burkholderiales bacterium]
LARKYLAYPLLTNYVKPEREVQVILSPGNKSDQVGQVIKAIPEEINLALENALAGFASWAKVLPQQRAATVLKMADLMEQNYVELLGLLVREAGKTLQNAISEVREAVDFCRYYANQVINEFDNDTHKPLG